MCWSKFSKILYDYNCKHDRYIRNITKCRKIHDEYKLGIFYNLGLSDPPPPTANTKSSKILTVQILQFFVNPA